MYSNNLNKYRHAKLKVGLLGGSFNPAHAGHLHISQMITKTLKLDKIWWLVAKSNASKLSTNIDNFAHRYQSACQMASNTKNIEVTDFEKTCKSPYSLDVLKTLQRRFPYIEFIWIIGADNLASLHKWHRWRELFGDIKIIVYDRPGYTYPALHSKAASAFAKSRQDASRLHRQAPAWGMLRLKTHPISSTMLREKSCKS